MPNWKKGSKDMSGDRGPGALPRHPLLSYSLTHVAVIIDGAGLASLQLPLHQVDEVLRVIGFCNLLLSGGQDLAWGGGAGGDGWRGGGREGSGVGFQKSGSRRGSTSRGG